MAERVGTVDDWTLGRILMFSDLQAARKADGGKSGGPAVAAIYASWLDGEADRGAIPKDRMSWSGRLSALEAWKAMGG